MGFKTDLQSNNIDLQTILDTINTLPEAGEAEQATPEISVSSSGLITATAGDKSATKQLDVQAAKTVTPSTSDQTAVASGKYTTGAITVKGDTNLIASNIKSGVSIFGVSGSYVIAEQVKPFTYTVDTVSGASYGFAINSNGYYESQNKGKDSSYAICRVNLTVNKVCDVVFDVINYAESNYDYAVFGSLDKALALTNSADSGAKENFKGKQSASVVSVTYTEVSTGSHFIDIKFIKDTSVNAYNDSVQFKIQEQEQEELNISAEDALIARNINVCINNTVKRIRASAFTNCSNLTSVSFPACTSIGLRAFQSCKSLISADFPSCTTIDSDAFEYCSSLKSVSFPACTSIGDYAFHGCTSLASVSFPACTRIGRSAFVGCDFTSVSFPACTFIGSSAFYNCCSLTSLYLTGSSLCSLASSTVFTSTPIGGYSATAGCYGSIYVPQSLLASYRATACWVDLRSRFVGLDENGNIVDGDNGDLANLITFTIDGFNRRAEEGMTWAEWVNSGYNNDLYSISGNFVVYEELIEIWYVCETDGITRITSNDVIIADYPYLTYWEMKELE